MALLALRLHPLNSRLKSAAMSNQILGQSSRLDFGFSPPMEKALRIRARGLEEEVFPIRTVSRVSLVGLVVWLSFGGVGDGEGWLPESKAVLSRVALSKAALVDVVK